VSFYVGRVEVTPEGWRQLKGQTLRAGMPAEVIVKTGERSLLAYLLKPFLVRLQTGMTER
jgi:protease secretion system membrane fusion protein